MSTVRKRRSSAKAAVPTNDLSRLIRAALTGGQRDLQLVAQRYARSLRNEDPALAAEIMDLLRANPGNTSPLRTANSSPIPIDQDSRLGLLRIESTVELEHEPVFPPFVHGALDRVVAERKSLNKLLAKGLLPTRSALFTGPPGVGKTMAARWLARELHIPLLTLDLSAVISSFLGRTGNNVRAVLDFAKEYDAVLLIDEFDAIAKRRDDTFELGELKRLVAVLLQEIDAWPSTGLLLAATNHPELLDRAVWRRFELKIEFPLPDISVMETLVRTLLRSENVSDRWVMILTKLFHGMAHNDVEHAVVNVRRDVAMDRTSFDKGFVSLVRQQVQNFDNQSRVHFAMELMSDLGISQRETHSLTGVSRDTLRKHARDQAA